MAAVIGTTTLAGVRGAGWVLSQSPVPMASRTTSAAAPSTLNAVRFAARFSDEIHAGNAGLRQAGIAGKTITGRLGRHFIRDPSPPS